MRSALSPLFSSDHFPRYSAKKRSAWSFDLAKSILATAFPTSSLMTLGLLLPQEVRSASFAPNPSRLKSSPWKASEAAIVCKSNPCAAKTTKPCCLTAALMSALSRVASIALAVVIPVDLRTGIREALGTRSRRPSVSHWALSNLLMVRAEGLHCAAA